MRRFAVLGIALAVAVMCMTPAMADKEAETKALVESGAKMAKDVGVKAILRAIGNPKGPFIKGDLYIFAGPLDKVTLSAHPYKAAATVGKDLSNFKDKKGMKLFVKFKEIANGPGKGWVEYWWPKPGAKEPSAKRTYILRVPGENLYLGAGYYK